MLEFFPHNYNITNTSLADLAIWDANDLIHALCQPHPARPYNSIGDAQLCALDTLADIFHDALLGVEVMEPRPTQQKTVSRPQHPTHEPIPVHT